MVYVIVFSLSVAFFSSTHQLGWVVLSMLLIWGVMQKVQKDQKLQRIQSFALFFAVMLGGVGAVVVYDWRLVGSWQDLVGFYQGFEQVQYWDPNVQLVVKERDKNNRYVVKQHLVDNDGQIPVYNDTKAISKEFAILLYSQKKLNPGDIIMTRRDPIWRIDQRTNPPLTKGGEKEERFDYNKRLYMQGLDGSLYDDEVSVVGKHKLDVVAQTRERFYQKVKHKYGDQVLAGLLAGMTIGDTSLITKERYQQFIDSGLVHLVAVSGGNIAIVVMFVGLLLFWLPFYVRQVVLLISIVLYAMLVGNDSSIVRAAVMGVLTILVLFPGRQLSIWRSMGYAWVGMLLRNPYYLLYDLGFGLSFAAIVGMVEVEEWGQKVAESNRRQQEVKEGRRQQKVERIRMTKQGWIASFLAMTKEYVLKNYILPTLGATLGVTPLLLWSMEQTNILAPLLNIFIVPLVPLMTIAGFLFPFIYTWTRIDTLLTWLLHWVVLLSALGREYGLYISMSEPIKNIFLLLCLVWRLYHRHNKRSSHQ